MASSTLTDFCNYIQKSVPFYKTDFFFVRREGNKKTVLFIQRSLPGLLMRAVDFDIEMEVTYDKSIPTAETNRGSRRVGGNRFDWDDIGPPDDDDEHYDVFEEAINRPRRGWTSQSRAKVLAHSFTRLSQVRIATAFSYGFEIICDGGLDLYAVESACLADSSAGKLINMCGKPISNIPLRKGTKDDVLINWTRPDSEQILEKLRKRDRNRKLFPVVGQSTKVFDLTTEEI